MRLDLSVTCEAHDNVVVHNLRRGVVYDNEVCTGTFGGEPSLGMLVEVLDERSVRDVDIVRLGVMTKAEGASLLTFTARTPIPTTSTSIPPADLVGSGQAGATT